MTCEVRELARSCGQGENLKLYSKSDKKPRKDLKHRGETMRFQFSSVTSHSLQPHRMKHARLPCPSPTPGAVLKLTSTEYMMPSNHFILCCPLLLLSSIVPSIKVFSNKSALHISWPEYWSFSFSTSTEYSELISLRTDWLDLLAVKGTLKSLL